MKEFLPESSVVVRNDVAAIQAVFRENVLPTYGRFEIALSHGAGSYVYDVAGKRYLDMGGGIAVCVLGHANPEITEALIEQSRKLVHVSNLYYIEPQGRLAKKLVELIGPGKCFFCNSGAEANEGLFKLARRCGHEEGRGESLTANNSFHGRTLAGIAATGQEKVKVGFGPMMEGFRHVPFNDLGAVEAAISPATVAVLIEGVQGEGGITAATPAYLMGLRELCDERKLLLMMDGVQCGHFRSGRFQSYQRVLEDVPGGGEFLPDAISMAKSLGGGFPIGAFWVRKEHADLLSPGTHGSTYGGSPLGCAVASRVLEVIAREKLDRNAREMGERIRRGLEGVAQRYPGVVQQVRGVGLMIGFELAPEIPALAGAEKPASIEFVTRLHGAGVLSIPAGARVVRLLPPLNLTSAEADDGLKLIEETVRRLAS